MRTKKERRGKRLDRKTAMLIGTGIGAIIILGLCIITAAVTGAGKIAEKEIVTFAVFAMAVGSFSAAFASAKISDIRIGIFTSLALVTMRIITGIFSGGRVFENTSILTIVAMLICGCLGAAIGGHRAKRRKF